MTQATPRPHAAGQPDHNQAGSGAQGLGSALSTWVSSLSLRTRVSSPSASRVPVQGDTAAWRKGPGLSEPRALLFHGPREPQPRWPNLGNKHRRGASVGVVN